MQQGCGCLILFIFALGVLMVILGLSENEAIWYVMAMFGVLALIGAVNK